MLHKEIPFLRIGLPLCAGIISGLYFKPDSEFLAGSAIIIVSGFATSLFFNRYQNNLLFGLTLTFAFFISGLLLYHNEKTSLSILKPEETVFQCTLSDYPEEKKNSCMLTVLLTSKNTGTGIEAVKGSMILYNKKDPATASFRPGDVLVIKCNPVEIANRGNPYEFDYRFYMENHGIKYYAFTNSGNILSHKIPSARKLVYRALIVRQKIIEMYEKRGITGERLALVSAITLGEKSQLDQEQKQNFIRAGVMHIMAVSGLHAVILSLFVFNLLFFLKKRFNILRILITILLLWSFAFVTGLTPSVMRATLMFTFIQAGNLMQRRVNGINSVLASAFVLILFKPSVIFDAGFLLSYCAVIYIISFYQLLYLKFQVKNWLTDKIWQSVVVTLIAQAGTFPLTLMLFNRFPTYFILTNLIIVPLSSLLIIVACLVPILYPLVFLSEVLASVLNFLTGLTEGLTSAASSLPWSNIENLGMTPIECLLLSGTIFLLISYLLNKKSFSILIPATFVLFSILAGTITEISVRTSNELIVYNTPGRFTVGIRTGKILSIYSDSSLISPEVSKHSATLGLRIKMNTLNTGCSCIRVGERKILICNTLNQNILQSVNADIVILTGLKPMINGNLTFDAHKNALILSSEASSAFHFPKQVNLTGTDTVHLVRKSGAFIKRI